MGLRNRLHDQAAEIKEADILITVTGKNNGARLLIKDALGFDCSSKAVDGWFAYLLTEDVYGVSVLVEPLNDPHRSAINRRTEEARNCRIAQIFHRSRKWNKFCLA